MKIIKSGKTKNIVCECECEFEYETQDILKECITGYSISTYPLMFPVTHYVNCPECGKKHIICTTYVHQSIVFSSTTRETKCSEE